MKIAMVSEHASPLAVVGGVDAGGQNVHVAALGEALVRHGNEVTVYTRGDDPDLPRRVTMVPGLVVEHVPAGPPVELPKDELLPHMGDFADYLQRRWVVDRPDVVHAHFWMSGLAALDAGRPLDLPVVQTFHALGIVKRRHHGERDTSPADRLKLETDVALEVDRVIATSTDELFELVRLGVSPAAVTVVPCGVDIAHFSPCGAAATGPPAGPVPSVLTVSRLVARKGVDDVIRALERLHEGPPAGARLLVAGGPPAAQLDGDSEAARLRDVADRHGVSGRVHFLGQVDRADMPALYRSVDVVACVPWYEPFGLVPLEAMACGVPVVASAVGGLVDTVVDGVTGVHVPPRDPDALAEVLAALLGDPARRTALGRAGARRARRRYSWDRIAEATAHVYAELVNLPAVRSSTEASLR